MHTISKPDENKDPKGKAKGTKVKVKTVHDTKSVSILPNKSLKAKLPIIAAPEKTAVKRRGTKSRHEIQKMQMEKIVQLFHITMGKLSHLEQLQSAKTKLM